MTNTSVFSMHYNTKKFDVLCYISHKKVINLKNYIITVPLICFSVNKITERQIKNENLMK